MGRRWPAAVLAALNAAVHAWDLLKEVAIICITSTVVWPQVEQLERPAGFPSSDKTRPDSPVPTLHPALYLGPNYGGGNEDNGNLLQKIPCMHCCTQCPQPCSRPPLTHPSARDSWTLTGKSGSVSCGVTAPFSYVLRACDREGPGALL